MSSHTMHALSLISGRERITEDWESVEKKAKSFKCVGRWWRFIINKAMDVNANKIIIAFFKGGFD